MGRWVEFVSNNPYAVVHNAKREPVPAHFRQTCLAEPELVKRLARRKPRERVGPPRELVASASPDARWALDAPLLRRDPHFAGHIGAVARPWLSVQADRPVAPSRADLVSSGS